ncbi:transposase [Streptomyces kaempferi]|uniref:Transposase n=1 Tax=Streptomyces kaempferi TaxID=333725 RepID=A0ABW3XNS7_9ACTN
MPRIWAGVDIGKEHHHCVVINPDGERLLSRRVLNDETALLALIADVLRHVVSPDRLAETAVQAAERQHTRLPGEKLVAELDKAIEARYRDHHAFDVITSMPGLGVIIGAEFLAATGGDMTVFGTADRLAGFGGVAPVPRDSGNISANLRRPQRYNRRFQRVVYISALFSIRHCDESRRFYDRKRPEGKRHTQAVLALARRRVNVLWALLRDGRCYELTPPSALTA